jgi:hypothetical protein
LTPLNITNFIELVDVEDASLAKVVDCSVALSGTACIKPSLLLDIRAQRARRFYLK